MKLSRFFSELTLAYNAELDDLRTDSEGNNVLKGRLAQKRAQVPQLLMMMQCNPEMVAVAFHGGITFKNTMVMESLITKDVSKLPAWNVVQKALILEAWAQTLATTALTDPDGDAFLVITAALEYLNKSAQSRAASPSNAEEDADDEYDDNNDDDRNDDYLNSDDRVGDEGESTEMDLDQAGAEWLAEQGFDRKE